MRELQVGLGTTMIEPARNGGRLDGIGVYTQALMLHLPRAGCEVTPFSYPPAVPSMWRSGGAHSMPSANAAGSVAPAAAAAAAATATAAAVSASGHIERLGTSVGKTMPQSFEAASLTDLLTPRAHRVHMPLDIFHVTDYRIVRMDCPVVATLHDALPIKYPQWCNPRLRGIKNWLQQKAARKADHIIALSHFAIDELVECFGIDQRRVSVVPCGIDDGWLDPPPAAAVDATLARHALRRGYFLFVGTLQPRKNVERLLDAYLALPAVLRAERQLVIVGAAGWRCETLLAQLSAAAANGEQVLWLKQVAGTVELRHLYAGAGVFVFPSLYEGYGIPVLEAFGAGVPVVTSNTTSLPEVSQGAAIEVDSRSAGAIGEAMLALVRDDALRARCIAAGLQRVQQLSWQASARQTAAVYHVVLSK